MTELLIFCLLVSLFCTGLFVSMNGKDMLLVPVANLISEHVMEFVRKPLFECFPCMASLYTLIGWIAVYQSISWKILPAMFIVCGLNSIIGSLISNWMNDGD